MQLREPSIKASQMINAQKRRKAKNVGILRSAVPLVCLVNIAVVTITKQKRVKATEKRCRSDHAGPFWWGFEHGTSSFTFSF